MPDRFPINTVQSPDTVLELTLKVKIRDAMSKKLHTAGPKDTLRKVQKIMKVNKISGVPIVEGKRLLGMVSVDDIITALDAGNIRDRAEKHMTRKLVVLEDDMPLSFAISYFNKYPYRRFPVLNREKKLVGIISSRDILTRLIREMDREIQGLEGKLHTEMTDTGSLIYKEFRIKKLDLENGGKASYAIKKLLQERDLPQAVIRRVAIASYELEINIVIHSLGGKLIFKMDERGITIIAKDDGPGISNIDDVLREGYSTANDWVRSLGFGAGMGLPNTKRVSDEFDMHSEPGQGTTVISIIHLDGDGNGEHSKTREKNSPQRRKAAK